MPRYIACQQRYNFGWAIDKVVYFITSLDSLPGFDYGGNGSQGYNRAICRNKTKSFGKVFSGFNVDVDVDVGGGGGGGGKMGLKGSQRRLNNFKKLLVQI